MEQQVCHHSSAECRPPESRSWPAAGAFIALFLVPLLLVWYSNYTVNLQSRPSDEELSNNLISRQAAFEELVRMLSTDSRALPAGQNEVRDFEALSRVVENPARLAIYKDLLRQISVVDVRYFANSGKLVLIPNSAHRTAEGSSKSYEYLPGIQPDPLVQRHGYQLRGPGVYFLTGDRHLTGAWYIHYETMISLLVSPY